MRKLTTNRRVLVLGSIGVAMSAPAAGSAQEATPVPDRGSAWPLYGHDPAGTRATDGGIDSGSVSALTELWSFDVGGPVSATPVIAGGATYVGSYDGNLYARDLFSGAELWTYATGTAVLEPNLQIDLGITGSAAVTGNAVYVGDAAANVHAIDRQSGQLRWRVQVDRQLNASIWSSPVFANGVLYVGVASIAKEAGFRGSVVALDAETGERRWQTYMVPDGADGAGVFGVPAIDAALDLLIVGTQNAYSPNPSPYGDPMSVVALDLGSGERRWTFQSPEHRGDTAPVDDVAFSASPNLFTVELDGELRDVVGIGQKSGAYWVLDRSTGEVIWQAIVSPPGFLGGMEGTSAVSDSVVVVPATDWPDFDGPAVGLVVALDASTGTELWRQDQSAPAASPASISNDLAFHAGMDGILHAYVLNDGTELWSADLQASVSGGVAIADGVVVVGAATPAFAPFVQAGNSVRAFGLAQVGPATPVG